MEHVNTRRLPVVLRELKTGAISRSAAADALGVSERQVNRLMKLHGVERPRGRAHERKLTAEQRRENKRRHALSVIEGVYDEAYAANCAGCSTRTMYRWVKRIQKGLKKPSKSTPFAPKHAKTRRKLAK